MIKLFFCGIVALLFIWMVTSCAHYEGMEIKRSGGYSQGGNVGGVSSASPVGPSAPASTSPAPSAPSPAPAPAAPAAPSAPSLGPSVSAPTATGSATVSIGGQVAAPGSSMVGGGGLK